MDADARLRALSTFCSMLQISGLLLIVIHRFLPGAVWVLIGICGFAAVVQLFVPSYSKPAEYIKPVAALAGVGIIVISLLNVS